MATYTAVTGSTTPLQKSRVDYSVNMLEGTIQRTWGPTTSSTTVLCVCDWVDQSAFVEDMLGWTTLDGTSLKRVLPERCPYNETQYALSVEQIQTTGFDSAATIAKTTYEGWPEFPGTVTTPGQAVFKVTYAAPLYALYEDAEVSAEHERYVVWKYRGVATNEQIPGGGFQIAVGEPGAGKKINQVSVKTGRTLNLSAKWLDIPEVQYAMISAAGNKVNSAELEWDGTSYPIGTVLFETWDTENRITPLGVRTKDLNFNFLIRTDGRTWNKFWANTGSSVEYVSVVDSATNPPFASADLNTLFTFAS